MGQLHDIEKILKRNIKEEARSKRAGAKEGRKGGGGGGTRGGGGGGGGGARALVPDSTVQGCSPQQVLLLLQKRE